jgi:hypothetical protein
MPEVLRGNGAAAAGERRAEQPLLRDSTDALPRKLRTGKGR